MSSTTGFANFYVVITITRPGNHRRCQHRFSQRNLLNKTQFPRRRVQCCFANAGGLSMLRFRTKNMFEVIFQQFLQPLRFFMLFLCRLDPSNGVVLLASLGQLTNAPSRLSSGIQPHPTAIVHLSFTLGPHFAHHPRFEP